MQPAAFSGGPEAGTIGRLQFSWGAQRPRVPQDRVWAVGNKDPRQQVKSYDCSHRPYRFLKRFDSRPFSIALFRISSLFRCFDFIVVE